MNFLIFLALLVFASIVCALIAAELANRLFAGNQDVDTIIAAIGLLLCGVFVYLLIGYLNPDPVETVSGPQDGNALAITGVSALLWVPIYLWTVSKRRKMAKTT